MGSITSKTRPEERAKRRAKRKARPDRGHRLSAFGYAFTGLLALAAIVVWGQVLLTK